MIWISKRIEFINCLYYNCSGYNTKGKKIYKILRSLYELKMN